MIESSKLFLVSCFLLVFLISATGCSNTETRSQKPNIIIFLADDMGFGDLSYSGNTNIQTPHIDSLAIRGASFKKFYVSPVCSPTRAELLTGRYHPRTGVYGTSAGGERMDLDETTIAEVFQNAGYFTGIFGKWHNGMQYPYHPNARGFDEFYGFASGHWGDYFSPKLLEHNGKIAPGNGYISDDFTNKALSFIENHKEQPFFVFITYNTPHSPMQVPDKWWEAVRESDITMLNRDPEREDRIFTRAALAMVKNIDWNVGRVTARLQDLGMEENTIVIYLSDNGPNSWRWNDGMKGRKGDVDEGGVRSPLFIRWPGVIEEGTAIDRLSAAIDLLPTLVDMTDIPFETGKSLDGVSQKDLLLGETGSDNDRFIYSHWNGKTSLRTEKWRMNHTGELYNMESDFGQNYDVSDEYPEIAETLADSLAEWEKVVLGELKRGEQDDRPFPVGHPDFSYTQLPARDGIPHGGIERSNRFPNNTFFTNWTTTTDSITWDIEVLEDGNFEVELYSTVSKEGVGSEIQLSFKGQSVQHQLREVHDPSLRGMENDRVERQESYVKDFRPIKIGTISLNSGRGFLTLKALNIPGSEVMDVRLLMLTSVQ